MASAAFGRYTGNGVNGRQITGIGFTPTGVLVFHEAFGYGLISWRTASFVGNGTDIAGTVGVGKIQSLDTDGFTLGDSGGTATDVNVTGNSYSWIAFIDSVGSNWAYGSYVGDGAATRNIDVGFQPTMVWNMRATRDVIIQTAALGLNAYSFAAAVSPGPGFLDGMIANGYVASFQNVAGATYYWLAWKSLTNFFNTGQYTGNGLDTRAFTTPAWQPKLASTICRQTLVNVSGSGIATWHHDNYSTGDSTHMWWGSTGTLANMIQQKLPLGFEIGSGANVNFTSEIYDWFQFGVGDVISSPSAGGANARSINTGHSLYPSITGNAGAYEFHKSVRKAMRQFNNLVIGDS